MITSDLFSSVEFYVIAITVAILIIGFIFKPSTRGRAHSYTYAADIMPADQCDGCHGHSVLVEAAEDGTVLLTRKGAELPDDAQGYFAIEVVGDSVSVTEKLSSSSTNGLTTTCDVAVRLSCLKPLKFHLRYEAPAAGLWGVGTIVNSVGFSSEIKLQY